MSRVSQDETSPISSAPPVIDPSGLWLDDLTEGMRLISPTYAVTEAEIISFAGRYDPQVFHTDPQRAGASFFGGLAASGWLTAAITMRLVIDSGLKMATGMIGLGNDLQWPSATRPGDVLHVEVSISQISPSRSIPDRATVSLIYDTLNQAGEIRQHTTGQMFAWRRPAPDASA